MFGLKIPVLVATNRAQYVPVYSIVATNTVKIVPKSTLKYQVTSQTAVPSLAAFFTLQLH